MKKIIQDSIAKEQSNYITAGSVESVGKGHLRHTVMSRRCVKYR